MGNKFFKCVEILNTKTSLRLAALLGPGILLFTVFNMIDAPAPLRKVAFAVLAVGFIFHFFWARIYKLLTGNKDDSDISVVNDLSATNGNESAESGHTGASDPRIAIDERMRQLCEICDYDLSDAFARVREEFEVNGGHIVMAIQTAHARKLRSK